MSGTIAARLGSLDFEERPRLKIGDRVVTRKGDPATVLGVGVIDYAPDGPAYETAEIEFIADGKRDIAFAVDLTDDEEDEDGG